MQVNQNQGASAEKISRKSDTELHLTIHEGKFHQVKRMMEAVGTPVIYLKRISMGTLTLPDDLKKGECRPLTEKEVTELKESVKR